MSQTTYTIHSITGDSVTCRQVQTDEFLAILEKEKPRKHTYKWGVAETPYYKTSQGILVQHFWGPAGAIYESWEDFAWTNAHRIELWKFPDRPGLFHEELLSAGQTKAFLAEPLEGYVLKHKDQAQWYYQKGEGPVVALDIWGRSGTAYPSYAVFKYLMNQMGSPPFLAIPVPGDPGDK